MGPFHSHRLIAGVMLALLLLGGDAVARTRPAAKDEIVLQADNAFYGLRWQVRIWKDASGVHRRSTLTDLQTSQTLSRSSEVRPGELAWLWVRLQWMRCWMGPDRRDWALMDSDRGTVKLTHGAHHGTYFFSDYWNVAREIEDFGQIPTLRALAQKKGMGRS